MFAYNVKRRASSKIAVFMKRSGIYSTRLVLRLDQKLQENERYSLHLSAISFDLHL